MELLEPTALPDWFAGWLKPLADPTEDVAPAEKVRAGARPRKPPPPAVTSVRLSSVRAQPVEWLWPGWLPLGKLCDLCGDPGLAKSTLLLDLAARISTNGVMPDGSQGISGGVCMMSAEDGLEDTIQPRLRAAGADLARVGFFEGYNRKPLVIPDHLDRIEVRLRDYDARLLLIDPLVAFLAQARSDQEVRKCLHPLKQLAEELRCTVLWLRHLSKRGGAKAIYRGSGHVSIIGAARSGLLVGPDPSDPALRVLAHAKSNLAPRQPSLTYRLEKVDEFACCRIVWGGPSELTADDLCDSLSRKEREEREETGCKLAAAVEFLNAALANGPRVVEELKAEAKVLGLVWVTVRRALRSIQGTTYYPHQTASRKHEWALPGHPSSSCS
ncbi:MAG TPA: AAA family ATPase [Gemmataceae bacterium]|nr:AAA family ATPase [Gemmataceae bacterium]